MGKAYPSKTPMVVRSLDRDKDPFKPKGDDDEVLGPEFPYLGAIGALMYLANCTRPGISLVVNLLARYNASLIKRRLVSVKNIFRYLLDTIKKSRYDHGWIL